MTRVVEVNDGLDISAPTTSRFAPVIARSLRSRSIARGRDLTTQLCVTVYAVAGVLGVVLALTQPAWSIVDEAWHEDYIVQLAHGVYPIEGVTVIRSETLFVMERTNTYNFNLGDNSPLPDLSLTTFGPPPPLKGYARLLWNNRHRWQFSNEAIQPPFYYALAVPVWILGNTVGGPFGALYSVRVFDALLAGLLAPLTLLIVLQLGGARRIAAGAGLLAAVLPGYVLNNSQITNDGAAAVLGAGCIYLVLRYRGAGWSARRAALAGLLVGAGIAVKPLAVGVLPFAIGSILWPYAVHRSLMKRVQSATILVVASCLPVLPWLIANKAIYGSWSPNFLVLDRNIHIDPYPATNTFLTFWSGEPASRTLAASQGMIVLVWLTIPFWLYGLCLLYGRRRSLPISGVNLLMIAAIGQLAVAEAIPLTSGGFAAPARYLNPALAAFLALYALGISGWTRGRDTAVAVLGPVVAVLAAISLLYPACLQPTLYSRRVPPGGLMAQPVAVSMQYRGVSVRVDHYELQPRIGDQPRGLWIHLTVRNDTDGIVEWSPAGRLSYSQGPSIGADYARGTPFPEMLRPSHEYVGWLRFNLEPMGNPVPTGSALVFRDIAVDDYMAVGGIALTLPPSDFS